MLHDLPKLEYFVHTIKNIKSIKESRAKAQSKLCYFAL